MTINIFEIVSKYICKLKTNNKEGDMKMIRVMVAGLPGKIIRDLKPEEIERINTSAEHYLMYVRNYRESDKVWVTRQAGE